MPIHGKPHHVNRLRDNWNRSLANKLMKSSVITLFLALIMVLSGIPITTVLPTSAPIWMGLAMLISK